MNYTKEQQIDYLKELGYTVEEYTYVDVLPATRSTFTEIVRYNTTLAYQDVPSEKLEAWKNREHKSPHDLHVQSEVLHNAFNREFFGRLYEVMLVDAIQARLNTAFKG